MSELSWLAERVVKPWGRGDLRAASRSSPWRQSVGEETKNQDVADMSPAGTVVWAIIVVAAMMGFKENVFVKIES